MDLHTLRYFWLNFYNHFLYNNRLFNWYLLSWFRINKILCLFDFRLLYFFRHNFLYCDCTVLTLTFTFMLQSQLLSDLMDDLPFKRVKPWEPHLLFFTRMLKLD